MAKSEEKPLTKIEETTASKRLMRCAFCEEYRDEHTVVRIGSQGSICKDCFKMLLERICREAVIVVKGDAECPTGMVQAVVDIPMQNLKLKARHEIHIPLKGE